MAAALVPDAEFVELFEKLGPQGTADRIGQGIRRIYARRESIEKKIGRQLKGPNPGHFNATRHAEPHPGRIHLEVKNGVCLVGSDFHIWPGPASVTHRAFVKFCKDLKPAVVIANGDVMDFPKISRHPPIGWESQPTVQQEIEAAQDRLSEIEKAAYKAQKAWCLGNHDARYETRLATVAPDYARIHGFHLKDHFPAWRTCWSTWINGDVVVKHRFKGGIHAAHSNAVMSGKHIITGHLHSAKVTPWTDYNGTRFGVDSGCVAEPFGPQFTDYTEDNSRNWVSGFCVLTFRDSVLLWPELVTKFDDNHVQFRGEVIRV